MWYWIGSGFTRRNCLRGAHRDNGKYRRTSINDSLPARKEGIHIANPLIITQLQHADPNAAPLTVNELIDLLNQLLVSNLQGSYMPYVISSDTPGVDDRDKVWIELDTNSGAPLANKIFYLGQWRRIWNGMPGEIRMFSGDPSIPADWSQPWPTAGRGIIGGKYDGWQICNGRNGSPNLTDKFIIGGHMDGTLGHVGYSGGWQTFVDGETDQKTGGKAEVVLTENNVPLLTNAAAGDAPGLWIYGHEAKEDAPHPGTKAPLVDSHYANLIPQQVNLTANNVYGKNPPDPTVTTPPFIAMGFIQFKGY